MIIVGVKIRKPIISSVVKIWVMVESLAEGLIAWGIWTMKRMMATKAPDGRLMKKHQRQVAYWVREPPMKGPRMLPIFAQPPVLLLAY
jgi:hypothetical protein